jgi:hypothetical protein
VKDSVLRNVLSVLDRAARTKTGTYEEPIEWVGWAVCRRRSLSAQCMAMALLSFGFIHVNVTAK